MKKQLFLAATVCCSVLAFAQVGVNTQAPGATLDIVGKPTDTSALDGVIAPRITGEQLRLKTYTIAQTGALVFVTAADTAPAGQTADVVSIGYYYFNGTKWVSTGGGNNVNIYNANGSLLNNRTVNLNGNNLVFSSAERDIYFDNNGRIANMAKGTNEADIYLSSGSGSTYNRFDIQSFPNGQINLTATGAGTEQMMIGTHATAVSAPLLFSTSAGSNASGTEKVRITGEGNVGVDTPDPTEKLDNNGITRLRNLPLNGAVNAIHTTPAGGASASQDQTFTASRTVVADVNGVLGYVNALPSDAGTSRVLVIANAPGTQDVGNQYIPNAAIGQFTNESLDIYNAWTNNVFTVPANMGGVYIIVMQNSNSHTSTGTATPTWHIAAYYEKSTDGGINWSTMIKHTYPDMAGTIVDNGNTLYWTGFLNAGDKVRVRFSCNSTTANNLNFGGLSITKLAQ